jgi:outer membrane protein TolC
MQRVEVGNQNLAQAMANVAQAQALLRQAEAQWAPTLGAQLGAQRRRSGGRLGDWG